MEVREEYIRERSGKGFLVKLFNVRVPESKRAWREHRHIHFEIALIKSGSGVYSVCGKSYNFSAGDLFVFSSNEIHCITEIGSGGMHIMNLHIDPRYFWGSDTERFSDYNLMFSHSDSFENHIPCNHPSCEQIKALILDAESELYSKSPEYRMAVRSDIIRIITCLVRECKYQNKAVTSSSNISAISKAVEYIHSGLSDTLRLCDIAAEAGMSASYFSNVFKSAMGITLWEYITEKRIDNAIRLIDKHPEKTMLEIALECGFNNTANFNKAFKKCTGLTPSEYKNGDKSMLY